MDKDMHAFLATCKGDTPEEKNAEGKRRKKKKIKHKEEEEQDEKPKDVEEGAKVAEGAKGAKKSHRKKKKRDKKKDKPLLTTYRMRPSLKGSFPVEPARKIIEEILKEKLTGKTYNPEDAGKWTREIADDVSVALHERLVIPRYKHVVQVNLGQQLGAGCSYVAKCSWDTKGDSCVSDVFTNATIFCVCTVFGVFAY